MSMQFGSWAFGVRTANTGMNLKDASLVRLFCVFHYSSTPWTVAHSILVG
jgi:hypothetical protein